MGQIDLKNVTKSFGDVVVIPPLDLTIEDGEMTPSLKIKRNVVTERYGDEIEALYEER